MQAPQIEMTAGNNPLTFSRIIAGMMNLAQWDLSPQERLDWIEAAMEMGVTTFDHADIYGDYTCEALFGEALVLKPSLREKIQIVTKCGIKFVSANRPMHKLHSYDTSRDHIISSAERSLENLQTDYLDVFLIHRPSPLMDPDDVAYAFNLLYEAGKVRHFGVSNFAPHHFRLLQDRLDFPLMTNQLEYSVLALEAGHDGALDHCQQRRIHPMIWSPLAGGRIFTENSEQVNRVRQAMADVAREHNGCGIDQVALAWIMRQPSNPLPVLGTGKLHRLQTAVDAAHLHLTREQWFAIWEASTGHEVP